MEIHESLVDSPHEGLVVWNTITDRLATAVLQSHRYMIRLENVRAAR